MIHCVKEVLWYRKPNTTDDNFIEWFLVTYKQIVSPNQGKRNKTHSALNQGLIESSNPWLSPSSVEKDG